MTEGAGKVAAEAAFAQVARRLSLFAQAVAGKPVALRAVAVPRAHWLGLGDAKGDARDDARDGKGGDARVAHSIELPLLALSAHALEEWRVRILREALAANQGGRRSVASALAPHAAAPQHHSILWRRVFAILDAGRVDAVIATRFPGAREALRRLRAETLQGRSALRWHRPLAATVEGLLQFSLGAAHDASIRSDPVDRLRAVLGLARDAMEASCPVDKAQQTVNQICALLGAGVSRRFIAASVPAGDRIALLAPDAAEAAAARSAESVGNGGDADSPNLAADGPARFQPGAGSGSSGPQGAEGASTADPDDPDALTDRREPQADKTRPQAPQDCAGHQTYDEWDHHAQRYLPDWTCVREQRLRGGDPQFLHGLRLRHAAVARQIRRRFGALRPEARVRLRRSADGDEIDLDSAIEQHVERRAGRSGDDRVYTAHKADRRDVCVAFLVDMSGSTGFQLPETAAPTQGPIDEDEGYFYGGFSRPAPSPPRRRVIDVAKDAIGLMCDGVEVLGDRHAVFGFSGEGLR
ncbi:hypothetical protein BH11PSE9_BH11PSE9_26080 [soil metagenome]